MKTKYKKLTLNAFIFGLGTFGSKAVGFFLVPLYTNILTASEYGVSDLIVTLTGLLLPLFSVSMGESILFYGLKSKTSEQKEKYFKNGFCVVLVGCLFLALLSPVFLLYKALNGFTWFLPIFAVLEILKTYLKYFTKSREKNIIYSIDSIIYAVNVAVLNVLFLTVFKWGVKGYLSAYILAELISFIFLFIFNRGFPSLVKHKIDKETITMMIRYSAPLMLNSIMWAISSSSDKIMLESMISSDAVGLYSAASKIPTISNTLVNFFCQAWTISTYLEIENNDKKFYSNTFTLFSFVLISVTSILIFIERPFMYLYVGQDFRDSSKYVPFLLIASAFQNYAAFFGSIIQSGKKNMFMLISTSIAACLNLVLNYVLILFFGIQGACIATSVSFLVVFVLRFVFSKTVISFPTKTLKLCVSIILIIVQAVSVALNWHFIIVSFNCFSLILLFNKNSILELFKSKRHKM